MKQYFSRIVADHWCAKNESQKAAHKLALEMERRIVSADKVLDFKAEFIDKVSRINDLHPRCKPLHLSIQSDRIDKGDIVFWIDGVFHLDLILAKLSL
jgi:hypothetical protein